MNRFLKLLGCGFFATLLAICVLALGRSFASIMVGVNENFYLKYYYDLVNSAWVEDNIAPSPGSIRIFNLQNYRSRQAQAQILDSIYKCNPAVIGLDVFYSDNPDIREDVNDDFIDVLKRIQDKTVFAVSYHSDSVGTVNAIYPFFKGLPGFEDAHYASTLSHRFYSTYLSDDASREYRGESSDTLEMMSSAVVNMSGKQQQSYEKPFRVNFSKKDLLGITRYEMEQIDQFDIEGKIVLVGDISDVADLKELPFRFGREETISGVETITYDIISLLKNDEGISMKFRGRGLVEQNFFFSFCLSVLFATLFCVIKQWFMDKKESWKKTNRFKALAAIVLQPFLFLALEGMIMLSCYIFTFFTSTIPDLFISMVSIALTGVSYELMKTINNKKFSI